jgi:hypothetical protein
LSILESLLVVLHIGLFPPPDKIANWLPNKWKGWTVLRVGSTMTIRGHSSFEARQLVLFGAGAIVVLIFVWTLIL